MDSYFHLFTGNNVPCCSWSEWPRSRLFRLLLPSWCFLEQNWLLLYFWGPCSGSLKVAEGTGKKFSPLPRKKQTGQTSISSGAHENTATKDHEFGCEMDMWAISREKHWGSGIVDLEGSCPQQAGGTPPKSWAFLFGWGILFLMGNHGGIPSKCWQCDQPTSRAKAWASAGANGAHTACQRPSWGWQDSSVGACLQVQPQIGCERLPDAGWGVTMGILMVFWVQLKWRANTEPGGGIKMLLIPSGPKLGSDFQRWLPKGFLAPSNINPEPCFSENFPNPEAGGQPTTQGFLSHFQASQEAWARW